MEVGVERGFNALGGLFQSVINDLKIGMPIWEDFLAKAAKLHTQLKSTIAATTSCLDAFQKIADLATNTKGATKDIGTALTRIILRHKTVEARLKTFTSSILDCLVLPLQEKMEDWKKSIMQLDKDHSKEYKRARQEIKKHSSDTLRLQKKVRKGKCEIQRSLDTALQNVNDKFLLLEEAEKHALRMALVEERSHFCLLVACLKPVVDEEVAMLGEMTHLQESMEQLLTNTTDPFTLPVATECIVNDMKGLDSTWSLQSPPSSPSSTGSRKSSVCSMTSVNSSSSGSVKSRSSPSHQLHYRSHQPTFLSAGTFRLSSVSSQDSGFTSQDTLFLRPPTPPPLELARQIFPTTARGSVTTLSTLSSPSSIPTATSTWPNLQETLHFETGSPMIERPHTISTAYEKGHHRPALTMLTFEPPDKSQLLIETKQGRDEDVTPTETGWVNHDGLDECSRRGLLPDFNRTLANQIVPRAMPFLPKSGVVDMRVGRVLTGVAENQEVDGQNSILQHEKTTESSIEAVINSCYVEKMSKYCTMPRHSNYPQLMSRTMAESKLLVAGGNGQLSTLRRSNSQTHKPPLPIRRTSSITSHHGLSVAVLRGQSATLRPAKENKQPAKQQDLLTSDLKAALENRKKLVEGGDGGGGTDGEKNGESTDASPLKNGRSSHGVVGSSSDPTSPRNAARRMSEPALANIELSVKKEVPPATKPKPVSNQDVFLKSLNSKLAEQVQKQRGFHSPGTKDDSGSQATITHCKNANDAAFRIRVLMASRPVVDPASCHESLLDQIRQGRTLRRAKTDDRSRPRFQ